MLIYFSALTFSMASEQPKAVPGLWWRPTIAVSSWGSSIDVYLKDSFGLNKLDWAAPSFETKCTGPYIIKPTEIHTALDLTLPQILQDWTRQLGQWTEPLSQNNEGSRAGSAASSNGPQTECLSWCNKVLLHLGNKHRKGRRHHCFCFHKSLRVIPTHIIQKWGKIINHTVNAVKIFIAPTAQNSGWLSRLRQA